MNQKTFDDILITRPTRDDVLNLHVGDLAPTVFGDMARVTKIFARGNNPLGKVFVCFYTEFNSPDISHDVSSNATISGSITEGEPVATIPAGTRYSRTENFPVF